MEGMFRVFKESIQAVAGQVGGMNVVKIRKRKGNPLCGGKAMLHEEVWPS